MVERRKKIRADFRKNRTYRTRRTDWTRRFQQDGSADSDTPSAERVSGKGELTRRRTIIGVESDGTDGSGPNVHLDVDEGLGESGRVLSVMGFVSLVEGKDGRVYRCATRRLLKTISTDQRHVVAAGDRVFFPHRAIDRRRRGDDRARRTASRLLVARSARPATRSRGQCRSSPDRGQRRRTGIETESHRSRDRRRRKSRGAADPLHQ